MKYLKYLVLTTFFALGVGWQASVSADATAPLFSVKAEQHPNQIDKKVSYFDLKLSPKDSTQLKLKLSNNDKEQAVFAIHANAAVTNDNLIIDYSQNNAGRLLTGPADFHFNRIVNYSGPKIVTVPAKTIATIVVDVNMPQQPFNGIIEGGIYITKQLDDKIKEQGGMQNRFSYVIGCVIRENDQQVQPNIVAKTIKTKTQLYRPNVIWKMSAPNQINISDLTVDGDITDLQNKKQIMSRHETQRQIAPTSNFNLVFKGDNDLKSGRYLAKVVMKDKQGHIWRFSQHFTVGTPVKTQMVKRWKMKWWYWLLIILLIIITYKLYQHFKQKKQILRHGKKS